VNHAANGCSKYAVPLWSETAIQFTRQRLATSGKIRCANATLLSTNVCVPSNEWTVTSWSHVLVVFARIASPRQSKQAPQKPFRTRAGQIPACTCSRHQCRVPLSPPARCQSPKKQCRGVPFICANVNKCRPAGIRRVGGLNPPLARAQAQHRVLSRALVATKSVGPVTPAQKQEKKTTMQAADNHVK